jgi:hypothetical protein
VKGTGDDGVRIEKVEEGGECDEHERSHKDGAMGEMERACESKCGARRGHARHTARGDRSFFTGKSPRTISLALYEARGATTSNGSSHQRSPSKNVKGVSFARL